MHAVPDRPVDDKSKETRLSRIEQLRKDLRDENYEPEMPQLEGAEYLIGYLWEVGPTADSGPVAHGELRAWQASIGIVLQPWETRFLRRLSSDYMTESFRATKPNCPAPAPEYELDHSITWKSLQKSLRDLANL